ncbi:MAG: hypothetical protein AABZ77_03515 [Chloroflexota bacterium]
MKDEFWHVHSNFLTSDPRQLVGGIFDDDKKNYERAKTELSNEVILLDDALILFVTSLQGGYRNAQQWEDNISVKAATAMANSTLNYLLLARYAVLLGYFPEARDLLRSCHERITRGYLFFVDKDKAQKFLSGKEIPQRDVDNRIATLLKVDEDLRKMIRYSYTYQSSLVHPNLESLSVRTAGSSSEELKERIVKYPIFGGLLPTGIGKPSLYAVIQMALFASKVIGIMFEETSGTWKKEYNRILKRYETFLELANPIAKAT